LDASGDDAVSIVTKEEEALLSNYRTPAANDIELYYVNYFWDEDANQRSDQIGYAFAEYSVPSNAPYVDSAAVQAFPNPKDLWEQKFVVAHEIGHVLTNKDHVTGDLRETKVMVAVAPTFKDSVTAPKRFTDEQEDAMLNARPNLVGGP
jgi:hypothetical protein